MSELPENLFEDILSRLPVKDLLRLRCVSKQWCALIDSPIFIKSQLNRSLETVTNLCLIFGSGNRIISADVDILDGVLNGGRVPPLDFVEVDNPIKVERHWTSVQGSCNGLICLQRNALDYNFNKETIALLNPWTKEYRILPPVPPHKWGVNKYHGIVYDPVGDDYKVIRIIVQFVDESKTLLSEVMVYGLRSNMWRRICESFAYYLYAPERCLRNLGVQVNGALHWLACSCRGQVDLVDIVVAFHPVDEEHQAVEVPKAPSGSCGTLGVLGGSLCLLYSLDEEDALEFWVMNDYMVKESWTKLFKVMVPSGEYSYSRKCARVLAYSKSSNNREIMLLQVFGHLFWYELYDQKVKRIQDLGICSFVAGIDLNVKSLVKLNHYQ